MRSLYWLGISSLKFISNAFDGCEGSDGLTLDASACLSNIWRLLSYALFGATSLRARGRVK
jgi:hypothetical protein